MTKLTVPVLLSLLLLTLLVPAVHAADYMVVLKNENQDPGAVARLVENAGASLVRNHAGIGVAMISVETPGPLRALRNHPSVEAVVFDDVVAGSRLPEHIEVVQLEELGLNFEGQDGRMHFMAGADVDPTDAQFFPLFGWPFFRIQAVEAWATGNLGDPDVLVALMGTGIDYTHPELAGTVDLSKSASFVPEDDVIVADVFPGAHPVADLNFHGTFVAGLVACNAIGTPCIAPNVTLAGVKVLNKDYRGSLARFVSGLEHATAIGADIIVLDYTIVVDGRDEDNQATIVALTRAINNAVNSGALFLNEAGIFVDPPFTPIDADNDGDALILPPQASPRVTVVGATGIDDQFSGFNHFGKTLVDIAAPGGAVPFVGPTVSIVFGPCSTFTQSPRVPGCADRPSYLGVLGSIPAVAIAGGVAALVDSREGGDVSGLRLRQHLIQTSDDILEPGFDAFSGHGRINAFSAVVEPILGAGQD